LTEADSSVLRASAGARRSRGEANRAETCARVRFGGRAWSRQLVPRQAQRSARQPILAAARRSLVGWTVARRTADESAGPPLELASRLLGGGTRTEGGLGQANAVPDSTELARLLSSRHNVSCANFGEPSAPAFRPQRQGQPCPGQADLAEQAVLDRVPLRRARGKVAHRDRQSEAVGQPLLQQRAPSSRSRAVGSAAIGQDQQLALAWVAPPSFAKPPLHDGFDAKSAVLPEIPTHISPRFAATS
jgi:hypothetical protein